MTGEHQDHEGLWDLRLFVFNHTPRSMAAFSNLKRMCEEHLAGNYRIEVIDLLEQPQLAKEEQIVAIPTVVRRTPLPMAGWSATFPMPRRPCTDCNSAHKHRTTAAFRPVGEEHVR